MKNRPTISIGTTTPAPARKNSRRQSGSSAPASSAAIAPPIGNELSTKATARPRWAAGHVSTTYVETAPQTPPSPSPAAKRSSRKTAKFGTSGSAAVKTPNTASESSSARLRPWLSASQPTVTLLTPMPSSVAVASKPPWAAVSPNVARMSGSA
ncbi:hypothetical protein OG738_29620 [Amycolatopsis sp. NBC_01488]|nr:hypothetical protein [Amycolatopsis sp. NBC_01488]